MSNNPKQRLTLTDLKEPQQIRELNRQLAWIWDQLLGGLSMKSLNAGTQKIINSKAEGDALDALGNVVGKHESLIEQTPEQIRMAVESVQVGGTNLVRAGEGTVWVINGHVDRNWEKSVWCRSGAGIILSPFTDAYNGVHFHTDVKVAPGDYTLSFWCWTYGTDIQPVLRCNLFSSADGIDHYFKDIQTTANTPVQYEIPISVTYSATVNLRMLTWSKFTTGELYISDVKLESGNTSTAWSPYPEEFRAGSSVEITEERVKIISPETLIGIPGPDGEAMVAQFDENGLTASQVIAGNIAYRYNGPVEVWINPNAETVNDSVYRSLADLFARLRGRYLDMGGLTIHMQGSDYGVMMLQRVVGGAITIYGNGVTLNGGLAIEDCTTRVYVNNLNIVANGVNQAARVVGGAAWVQWHGCTFNGNGADHALYLVEGGGGMVWDCGMYNATNLIYAGHASDVSVIGARGGNCTYFAATDGCTIKLSGSRPDGAWSQHNNSLTAPGDLNSLPIDYGSAQPSVPTIQTASWNYLYSDSYARGWNSFTDDDVRQGYNGQIIHGVMWFDAAAIRSTLSGRTIKQASLRLYMHTGVGRAVDVSVQLYGSNVSYDRTDSPALLTSYGTIGTTSPGVVNEITIPTQVITDIVNGTIQALVLMSDDDELYKDRDYSKNYARFSGSTLADGNTCPRLTVVYE